MGSKTQTEEAREIVNKFVNTENKHLRLTDETESHYKFALLPENHESRSPSDPLVTLHKTTSDIEIKFSE